MKKKLAIFALAAILVLSLCMGLTACSRDGGKDDYAQRPNNNNPGFAGDSDIGENDVQETSPDRKIIYFVDIYMTADDVAKAAEAIKKALASGEWTDYESSNENYVELKLRVQTGRLDEFTDAISGTGKVTDYRKTSKDISLEYSDASARKRTLEAERDRLNTLLGSAESIDTVLAIEKRIAEINTEIDKINGTLNQFDSLADYSTVTVRISKTGYEPPQKNFGERIRQAFENGWEVGKEIIVVVLAAIPFLAVIAAIVLLILFAVKKAKAKRGIEVGPKGAKKQIKGEVPAPQPEHITQKPDRRDDADRPDSEGGSGCDD